MPARYRKLIQAKSNLVFGWHMFPPSDTARRKGQYLLVLARYMFRDAEVPKCVQLINAVLAMGIAGFILHGGHGMAARAYGLTLDW